MESPGKQGSSDSSSEENDRLEQVKEDTATTKRSYECTFCKRGFTNAQALGGHMNIHRKDRAKAKQTTSSSFSNKSMAMNEDYMNPRYIAPVSSEPAKYYPVFEAQRDYLMYCPPSASSPRDPHAYNDAEFSPRSQSLRMNEELLGANLSLGISPTYVEDNDVRRETMEEEELDLELRLGHTTR